MNSRIIIRVGLGVLLSTGASTNLFDVWFFIFYYSDVIYHVLTTYSHVCTYTFCCVYL